MDIKGDPVWAWALLTHQRFLLRRAVMASVPDVGATVAALERMVRLCDRAGARRLEVVAALARRRVLELDADGQLERGVLYQLVDAIERTYAEALLDTGVAASGGVRTEDAADQYAVRPETAPAPLIE